MNICNLKNSAEVPPSANIAFYLPRVSFTERNCRWEQIFYGEFDGKREKRILIKMIGE